MNFETLTLLATNFAPFFFSVVFIFYVIRFAATNLNAATPETIQVYRWLSYAAWVCMIILITFACYVWFFYIFSPQDNLIRGTVTGFSKEERLYSQSAYILKTNRNEHENTHDFNWVAYHSDIPNSEVVDFTVKSECRNNPQTTRLLLSDLISQDKQTLEWHKPSGSLRVVKPRVVNPPVVGFNLVNMLIPPAMASDTVEQPSQTKVNPVTVACGVDVRAQQCKRLIKSRLYSSNQLLNNQEQGLELLKKLNELSTRDQQQLFRELDGLGASSPLEGRSLDKLLIFTLKSAGELQAQSLKLAASLNQPRLIQFLGEQLKNQKGEQRYAALEAIKVSNQTASLETPLRSALAAEPNPFLQEALQATLNEPLVGSNPSAQPLSKVSNSIQQLNLAKKQNKKDTVWYATSSATAMAKVLQKAGITLVEKKFWYADDLSTDPALTDATGKHQAGDLLFFNYGKVMMQTGDNVLMGFTANGVERTDIQSLGERPWATKRFAAARQIPDDNDDETALKQQIIAYYADQGEWAGTYQIAEVLNFETETISATKLTARVKYAYEPINSASKRQSGFDHRLFELEQREGQWFVTNMGPFGSGQTIVPLFTAKAQSKVVQYYADQSRYAGIYQMKEILEIDFVQRNTTSIVARTQFDFLPARLTTNSQDQRETRDFYFEFVSGDWQVVYMSALN